MKRAELQALLFTSLAMTGCTAPDDSPYGRCGRAMIRMASAYESDGKTFLAGGDPVNALAAFQYGLGWLHCGEASGLLTCRGEHPGCPFNEASEPVPASHSAKLDEKTRRYARLLDTALASVTPAPDPGASPYTFAVQVQFIAMIYLRQGTMLAASGKREDALACFSYGHGWLDAGVQAGLFIIHANREIFTVD
ncbi:DUF357 domain-containing protein [Methanoregula sp.]|uniref:DUF357 domain-containing protein n=1 Tax=Methanoregula sp. TaxID=2052170 RepID=UPI00236F103E|nr:DUF357 domain-containing protein [Methanoregula sp.]MDD1686485.1 DUF357 domain-containing protein [Methanoregula sp.]